MNTRILYSGKFGSTRAGAEALSLELNRRGMPCRCMPVSEGSSLGGVDRLIMGAPIYYGKCPQEVIRFLDAHARELAGIRVLFFFTCLRLTRTGNAPFEVHVDPQLAEPAKPFKQMGMMEKSHCLDHYLAPIRERLEQAGITRIAFFKGNLDLARLDLKSRLVMTLMSMVMPQAAQGEYLDIPEIWQWALDRLDHGE